MNPIDILTKYWGHTKFRLKQELIISEVINNQDVLALLPTGGGKSVCYQVPALMREGLCIVISPLISLMNDQVRHLNSKGIKSISISSSMNYAQIDTALTNCIYGGIKFLYLSPEKLQHNLIKTRIVEMNINLITVDEAHCISEWGHNFRPSYRHISDIRKIIPNVSVLALTATANKSVSDDIQSSLVFKKTNIIRSSFLRPNMSYVVDTILDKESRLIKLLNKIKSSVIIYVGTRRLAEEISTFLNINSFSANFYHAGLSSKDRNQRQLNWTNNETRIIVATNSFGMGIDKQDVKLVVHMGMPSSIEAYFQEAGRAGRNGNTAYAFLLANSNDIKKQNNLLKFKYPKIIEIVDIYQNISSYLQIAVGDEPEETFAIDIDIFSKRYNLSRLKVYHSIKYLEKEELIKLLDDNFSNSKFKFIISSNELYKFQISNKYYDSFIRLLLRTYSNSFNHLVSINLSLISKKYEKSLNNILLLFKKLKDLEIIDFKEESDLPQIKFLSQRIDLNINHLNKQTWNERRSFDQNKLNAISEYVTNKSKCRSSILLNFFGEKTSESCGVCDICIIKKRSLLSN